MALGDDEFLFRYLARWLEFVGDGGGRVHPLREYSYDDVVNWLTALDQLDQMRSDFPHVLAARYFGEITPAVDPGSQRLRKIFGYLRIVGLADPARFWPWLIWDADKARKPINDPVLIAMIARDLQSPELRNPRVPAWVRVLPVRLYEAAGDPDTAKEAQAHIDPADAAEVIEMRRRLAEAINKLHLSRGGGATPTENEPQAPTQNSP